MRGILCVIPARGNSKGIKRKNLKKLNGNPLIYYSIKSAIESSSISRLVVSTEDQEIADLALRYGADVPFLRPKSLSEDNIHSVFPVIDVLKKLKQIENYEPDGVMMFLPTSPLTTANHLDEATNLFFNTRSNVISVTEYDKPLSAIRLIKKEKLVPVIRTKNYNIQRQDYQHYIVNAAIYISTPDKLINNQTFHIPDVTPFIMDKEFSMDINDIIDFQICESILFNSQKMKNEK